MNKSSLTNSTEGRFDSLKVRNPPYSGAFVDVTSLGGGGGGSYDDTALTNLVNANTNAISSKHPSITVQDANGGSHTGITTINAVGGAVTGTTLTLPVQAGAQGAAGADSTAAGVNLDCRRRQEDTSYCGAGCDNRKAP